jgi:hypothetical protein
MTLAFRARAAQRIAGAGGGQDVSGGQVLGGSQGFHQSVGFAEEIAARLRNDLANGLERFGAGAEGVLVGVEFDGVRRNAGDGLNVLGKGEFVVKRQGGAGRQQCGQASEVTASEAVEKTAGRIGWQEIAHGFSDRRDEAQ